MIKIIATYDVETQGFSKDILCGSIAYRNYKEELKIESFKNGKEMINRMKEIAEKEQKQGHKIQYYAHNADYDSLRLIDLNDPDLKIIKATRDGIYAYKIGPEKKISMVLYNSMKIFPMGLEKVGKIIGHEKTRPPKEIDNKMKNPEKQTYTLEELNQIIQYNQNDCIVLLKALEWIKTQCKQEGLKPRELRSIGQIAQNMNQNTNKI